MKSGKSRRPIIIDLHSYGLESKVKQKTQDQAAKEPQKKHKGTFAMQIKPKNSRI
jgi:predicted HicB family RNase H-like nuclease